MIKTDIDSGRCLDGVRLRVRSSDVDGKVDEATADERFLQRSGVRSREKSWISLLSSGSVSHLHLIAFLRQCPSHGDDGVMQVGIRQTRYLDHLKGRISPEINRVAYRIRDADHDFTRDSGQFGELADEGSSFQEDL